ncbi:hypothetical protein R5W24_006491 [Gemmata sp. JC717]|uniref:hypothetical protein n=1 Tax=Gemmata algarum TaxID=2975278 RepID=UPI0021BAF058|nr:hypothetical protein [Gemmata algarum]MDY3557303.1 hypothetical protein [Gemmata algarum]
MTERWRDVLLLLLFVAIAVGTYTAAQAAGTYEPLPTFLPLLCMAAFVVYKAVPWLLGTCTAATPRAEFSFPVHVLRNPTGLILCTEEPDGGHLAVFTGPAAAVRFRDIRNIPEWSPVAFSHTELLEALQWLRRAGDVQYVMIDPLVGPYGFAPAFPLSHCIACLVE